MRVRASHVRASFWSTGSRDQKADALRSKRLWKTTSLAGIRAKDTRVVMRACFMFSRFVKLAMAPKVEWQVADRGNGACH